MSLGRKFKIQYAVCGTGCIRGDLISRGNDLFHKKIISPIMLIIYLFENLENTN